MNKELNDLREIIKTQCSDGNWNYDPYMHGMANGLILAESLLTGDDPKYLEAPDVWLKDLPPLKEPLEAVSEATGYTGG